MVSIIILSYNTKALLQKCITSLYYSLDNVDYEIIVVDNASSDESVAMVKKKFPKVVVIENKENDGFSKGNNKGVKHAKGEYILFLNSDTTVHNDALKDLLAYMKQNSHIAVAAGVLENPDGSQQRAYGNFYSLFSVFLMLFGREKGEMLRYQSDKMQSVDWVTGACMLVKKDIFDTIGGFDERLFMYLEDMELCYRIKKMNYSVIHYPLFRVTHLGYGSSNRSFAILQIYKGLLYFYKKHRSLPEYYCVRLLLKIKAAIAVSIGILQKNDYLVSTYKQAFSL